MGNSHNDRIQKLAKTALEKAEQHCRTLNCNPDPHLDLLATLVIEQIQRAISDIAHDKEHGGPSMAYALTQPFFQEIYFNDASRTAAEHLVAQVGGRGGVYNAVARH